MRVVRLTEASSESEDETEDESRSPHTASPERKNWWAANKSDVLKAFKLIRVFLFAVCLMVTDELFASVAQKGFNACYSVPLGLGCHSIWGIWQWCFLGLFVLYMIEAFFSK